MRVLYFGSYNQNHPRNRILIRGLKLQGIEITEIHDRSSFLLKYWRLFRRHWKIRGQYDYMIVGFPGFVIMPLARVIATAPVIFDAFVSYYDANVFDRQIVKPGSWRAKYFYFLDWMACQLADVVLLETDALIDYFVKTFHIKKEKFRRVFIGANDEIFHPAPEPLPANQKFTILFWGWMIPSHGVPYILDAARILANDDLEFVFVGGGPKKPEMLALKDKLGLKNVRLLDPMPPEQLVLQIQQADVCLGVFGDVPRLMMVVTNKVYEALACAKPVITANPGAKEILSDGIHCLFCKIADSEDLVKKILQLKNDSKLRLNIAKSGHKLYEQRFSTKALGLELKNILKSI